MLSIRLLQLALEQHDQVDIAGRLRFAIGMAANQIVAARSARQALLDPADTITQRPIDRINPG
jgi:hypothetical protein